MPAHHLTPDQLAVIEQVVRHIARRHHLSADEEGDLRGDVQVRLLEHGDEILGRFQQRSSLRTYLTVVVHRIFLDRRIADWGKWRPSAEAKRRGPVAVLLERYVTRDGLSFDEAVETLRTNHAVTEAREALHDMFSAFPVRRPRRFVGEDELEAVAGDAASDATVQLEERRRAAQRLTAALARVMASLPERDRLIVQLRFGQGLPVSHVARMLGLAQKPLYGRLERLLAHLHRGLAEAGIRPAEVAELLGRADAEVGPVLGRDSRPEMATPQEIAAGGPSMKERAEADGQSPRPGARDE